MPPQPGTPPLPVHRPWLIYIEWVVFTALICALVGMWWFLEFRPRPQASSESTAYRVPEQVVNNLLLGNASTTPQSIPKVVVKNLSAPPAQKKTEPNKTTEAPMPPPQVLQFLTSNQ